jgi:hypothetical protein
LAPTYGRGGPATNKDAGSGGSSVVHYDVSATSSGGYGGA